MPCRTGRMPWNDGIVSCILAARGSSVINLDPYSPFSSLSFTLLSHILFAAFSRFLFSLFRSLYSHVLTFLNYYSGEQQEYKKTDAFTWSDSVRDMRFRKKSGERKKLGGILTSSVFCPFYYFSRSCLHFYWQNI